MISKKSIQHLAINWLNVGQGNWGVASHDDPILENASNKEVELVRLCGPQHIYMYIYTERERKKEREREREKIYNILYMKIHNMETGNTQNELFENIFLLFQFKIRADMLSIE